MADDAVVGSGATTPLDVTVAADEIAGAKYQRVKLTHGVDGSAVDASATNPLPITGALSVTGTMVVDSSHAEDAAHVSGDVGSFVLAVRNDAGTALAGTTGDYIPLSTDATGNLRVTGGGGGTQYVEDVASAGGETVTIAGAVRQDTLAPSTSADGDYATLKVNSAGALYTETTGTITTSGTMTTELTTGLSVYSNTALSNTKQAVKASAGKVYGWMVHNPSAATAYIQVWNVATGSITVGTTAPTWTIPLPAGASANVMSERGVTHSTEINIAATTTATGSTAPATALVVSIFYI